MFYYDYPWLIISARTLVGLILLASAILKLRDLPAFGEIIRGFALVPPWAARSSAVIISLAELFTGACLLWSTIIETEGLAWAPVMAMGLFALFGGAVTVNLVRGRRDLSCGCFGGNDARIGWRLVARSALLFVCAWVAVQGLPFEWVAQGHGLQQRIAGGLVALAALLLWNIATATGGLWRHGTGIHTAVDARGEPETI
jgi:hypothetical protein